MITAPPGWKTSRRGDALVLAHGPATITYREVVRPAITREAIAQLGAVEWLVTHEGEDAALVVAGSHALGFVLLDGYHACLHGPAELAGVIHDLVLADVHALGIRRRPFRYTAPRGWTLETCGFEATWCAPDRSAAITVHPAWPADAPAALEGTTLVTSSGLTGALLDFVRPDLHRTVAVLQDDRYLYPLRLDARDRRHRTMFVELVHSVQPIPRARRASSPQIAEAVGYTAH